MWIKQVLLPMPVCGKRLILQQGKTVDFNWESGGGAVVIQNVLCTRKLFKLTPVD